MKQKKTKKKKEKKKKTGSDLRNQYEDNTILLNKQIREVFEAESSKSQIPNGGLLFDNFPSIFENYYKTKNKTINLIARCKASGFKSYRAMVETCGILKLTTEELSGRKQAVLRIVR